MAPDATFDAASLSRLATFLLAHERPQTPAAAAVLLSERLGAYHVAPEICDQAIRRHAFQHA